MDILQKRELKLKLMEVDPRSLKVNDVVMVRAVKDKHPNGTPMYEWKTLRKGVKCVMIWDDEHMIPSISKEIPKQLIEEGQFYQVPSVNNAVIYYIGTAMAGQALLLPFRAISDKCYDILTHPWKNLWKILTGKAFDDAFEINEEELDKIEKDVAKYGNNGCGCDKSKEEVTE